jgi:hypothetical protein
MTSSIHCFSIHQKKAIEMGVLLSVSNRLLYDARGTDHHVIHIVIPA